MLDDPTSWAASSANSDQWLQIDLGDTTSIKGIVTQGRGDSDQWVTSYQIATSLDGTSWSEKSETFNANDDQNTKVENFLNDPVEAQYIRIYPVSWSGWISMRCGIIVVDSDCIQGNIKIFFLDYSQFSILM